MNNSRIVHLLTTKWRVKNKYKHLKNIITRPAALEQLSERNNNCCEIFVNDLFWAYEHQIPSFPYPDSAWGLTLYSVPWFRGNRDESFFRRVVFILRGK